VTTTELRGLELHNHLRALLQALLEAEGLSAVSISRSRFEQDLTVSLNPGGHTADLDLVEVELNRRGWRCFREEGAREMTTHPEDHTEVGARAGLLLRPEDMCLWDQYGSARRAGIRVWPIGERRVNVGWSPAKDQVALGSPRRLEWDEKQAMRWKAIGRAEALLEADGWTVEQRISGADVFLIAELPGGSGS
jgi:hypothetical protein